MWESCYSKIDFKIKYIHAKTAKKYMGDDIHNYLSTVMFRKTPCIKSDVHYYTIYNVSYITFTEYKCRVHEEEHIVYVQNVQNFDIYEFTF